MKNPVLLLWRRRRMVLLYQRKDTERHGCAVKFRARPLR